ncbi:MAG: metal-dependent hydrolase [Alphaproteobacteria bacterium]|nr:metal-dependent hydrolase [Alphaproteobacteria bacterium]
MMIGHLPSAYLVYKIGAPRTLNTTVFMAGMVGALFPDIDLLWFYFVDNRAYHHHEYLTHRPAIWLGLLVAFFVFSRYFKNRLGLIGMSFCIGAITHVVFDSTVGKIFWLWPFSDYSLTLVTVQATHSHFMLSFLAHWTFKVEIAVTTVAVIVFLHSRYRKRKATPVPTGNEKAR